MHPKYEEDFYDWAMTNAALLKQKKFDEVDIENIIEEIESMGRSEKYELINRLSLVISHLLKWHYQPTKRTRSWDLTIKEQRRMAKSHFKDNPSLKSKLAEILEDAYYLAKLKAERDTLLPETTFPDQCPYTFEKIMSDEFYPDSI